MRTKAGDCAELELERVKLVKKILKSKDRISYLYKEREHAIEKVQKYIQNEREVLDWKVAENEKDIRERRHVLEERLNELEAEKDIAADQLAEAEIELSNKIAEEDRGIHTAQEHLFKLEEEILKAIREDDIELKAKQVKFEEENKERSLAIAKERRAVVELAEKVEKLREDSLTMENDDEELQDFEAKLEVGKTRLREMEEKAIVEEKKAEELLGMAGRDFKRKQAEKEVQLQLERTKIEELKNHKQKTIKKFAKKVSHLTEMLGDAKAKLKQDKQRLKELEIEEETVQQKLENGVISIARKLSEEIETLPEESHHVALESLIYDLDVVNNSGRTEISQKEAKMNQELDKLRQNEQVLQESVVTEEKEKERIESDLKEMREVFLQDRTGEKMELMKFVEKIGKESDAKHVDQR